MNTRNLDSLLAWVLAAAILLITIVLVSGMFRKPVDHDVGSYWSVADGIEDGYSPATSLPTQLVEVIPASVKHELPWELDNVLAEVRGEERYDEAYLAQNVVEAWEASPKTSEWREALRLERARLHRAIKQLGFDPKRRYLGEDIARILSRGKEDPFWCTDLNELIASSAKIAKELGLFLEWQMYRRHEADYLVTNHICEDGVPQPEPSRASEIYLELGLRADANVAMVAEAYDNFWRYAYRADPYRPWNETALNDTKFIIIGIEWLRKAGKTDGEVRKVLREWGAVLEGEGFNRAASQFYGAGVDVDSVIRTATAAQTAPEPTGDEQAAAFIRRLAEAEGPHPISNNTTSTTSH